MEREESEGRDRRGGGKGKKGREGGKEGVGKGQRGMVGAGSVR